MKTSFHIIITCLALLNLMACGTRDYEKSSPTAEVEPESKEVIFKEEGEHENDPSDALMPTPKENESTREGHLTDTRSDKTNSDLIIDGLGDKNSPDEIQEKLDMLHRLLQDPQVPTDRLEAAWFDSMIIGGLLVPIIWLSLKKSSRAGQASSTNSSAKEGNRQRNQLQRSLRTGLSGVKAVVGGAMLGGCAFALAELVTHGSYTAVTTSLLAGSGGGLAITSVLSRAFARTRAGLSRPRSIAVAGGVLVGSGIMPLTYWYLLTGPTDEDDIDDIEDEAAIGFDDID